MHMKRFLLASSALALLGGAQQAQAEMYVSVLGGANFLEDSSGVFPRLFFYSETHAFSSDADTGFLLGAAIGTRLDKWAKGLRVELEVSYRRNDVGGVFNEFEVFFTPERGVIVGNMSTFAMMANVWYDIDIGNKVKPYVGVGAGWARMRGDAVFIATTNSGSPTSFIDASTLQENNGFAWQLSAGFHYEVAPDVNVGIGYRYFDGPNFSGFFEGNGKIDNVNHSVLVDLTIGIN